MKSIAIVCCECVPFIKVGGLGDVTGALYSKLPRYLDKKVFLPGFRQILEKFESEKILECDVFFSQNRIEKVEASQAQKISKCVFNRKSALL